MRKIETEASVAEVTSRQNLPQKAVWHVLCFFIFESSSTLIAMNTTRVS